jgi:hypothetical protein
MQEIVAVATKQNMAPMCCGQGIVPAATIQRVISSPPTYQPIIACPAEKQLTCGPSYLDHHDQGVITFAAR